MNYEEDRLWHSRITDEVKEMEEMDVASKEQKEIIKQVRKMLEELDVQIMCGNPVRNDKNKILLLLKSL
jgi:hypothetical protein